MTHYEELLGLMKTYVCECSEIRRQEDALEMKYETTARDLIDKFLDKLEQITGCDGIEFCEYNEDLRTTGGDNEGEPVIDLCSNFLGFTQEECDAVVDAADLLRSLKSEDKW